MYYKEALDVRRSILGYTHPHTLVSLGGMGNLLQAQGCRNNIFFHCIISILYLLIIIFVMAI